MALLVKALLLLMGLAVFVAIIWLIVAVGFLIAGSIGVLL